MDPKLKEDLERLVRDADRCDNPQIILIGLNAANLQYNLNLQEIARIDSENLRVMEKIRKFKQSMEENNLKQFT